MKSDHKPVLISLQPKKCRGDRLFCYLSSWFCHGDLCNVVTSNWNNELSVVDNLELFKGKIVEWNKQVYGNIF